MSVIILVVFFVVILLTDFPDQAREKLLTLTDSRPILLTAEALASSEKLHLIKKLIQKNMN